MLVVRRTEGTIGSWRFGISPRAQARASAGHGAARRARAGRRISVDGFLSRSSRPSFQPRLSTSRSNRVVHSFSSQSSMKIAVVIVFDGSRRSDSSCSVPGPSRPAQTQRTADDHRNRPPGSQPAVLTPVLRDALSRLVRRRPCRRIRILIFDSNGIPDSFSLRSLPACCSNS